MSVRETTISDDALPGVPDGAVTDVSFTSLFTRALQGHAVVVHGLGEVPERLPVHSWNQEADAADLAMLSHCVGLTVDIGCGPGRLTAALSELGHVVLGIDVVHEAVWQTRDRGVSALRRDVFEQIPGEGRWQSALLADGNLGIGGDPVALLTRVRELLDPGGRVVAEVAAPGVPTTTDWAVLECDDIRSRPFRWSVVGTDDIASVASQAGLALDGVHGMGDRWCAVLTNPV